MEYIQNPDHQTKEYTNSAFHEYILKPSDELYIQISSLDDVQSTISSNTGNLTALSGPYGASLSSQKIDKDGFVELPVIGKIHVEGKTVDQVTAMLKESLKNILNLPLITVKLVDCYVSVIGEVHTPGHYVYTQDKLTIFDALSLAGDISDYGDRRAIIHVRTINGKTVRTELDITKPEIVSSDYYYLQPNDLIYVRPMRVKIWAFKQSPFEIFISSLTLGLLIWEVTK